MWNHEKFYTKNFSICKLKKNLFSELGVVEKIDIFIESINEKSHNWEYAILNF